MPVAALGLLAAGCAQPAQGDRATLAVATVEDSPSDRSGGRSGDRSGDRSGEDAEIGPAPTGGSATASDGRPWDAAATAACEAAVGAGLAQVAQSADGGGMTTLWSHGEERVICDLPTGGAEPTVIRQVSGSGAGGLDERVLGLTVRRSGTDDASTRIVAGGVLPYPVQEIRYTFPDGHSEQARFLSGESSEQVWWLVTHTAIEGVLVDPKATSAPVDPVTISVLGEAAEAFRVPWKVLQRSE